MWLVRHRDAYYVVSDDPITPKDSFINVMVKDPFKVCYNKSKEKPTRTVKIIWSYLFKINKKVS
jgi:hypothetical protein